MSRSSRSGSRCSAGGSVRPREHGPDRAARATRGGGGDRHPRRALRREAAGRGNRRAGADGGDRVPDRRVRRPRDRPQPAARLSRHLQRRRSQLGLSSDDEHRVDLGVQPHPDPAADDHPHSHRAGRGIRVPLRHVQHRRPGPVPGRPVRRQLARLLPRRHAAAAAHPDRRHRRDARRGRVGRDRRFPESDRRRARGDLDDHAQLDRDLGGDLAVRRRRPAPELGQQRSADLERRRSQRTTAGLLGSPGAPGPRRRLLRRARGARRLCADSQPDDARVRGARGRVQPGGGRLRRNQREEEPDPRDGDLRRRSPGWPAHSTCSVTSTTSGRPTSR